MLCAYSQHELARARSVARFLPVRLAAGKTLEAVIFASGANQWLTGAARPWQTADSVAAARRQRGDVKFLSTAPGAAHKALTLRTARAAQYLYRAHSTAHPYRFSAKDDGAPPHHPRVPLRHADRAHVEGAQKVEEGPGKGKISGTEARSRRPAVLRRLHAVDATRVHLTMKWVVSFSNLTPFGPRRCSAQAHRRAPVLRALQVLRAAVAFVD